MPLKYTSPMNGVPQIFFPMHLQQSSPERTQQRHLDIKVTTPLFYTQVVRFAHLTEFFTMCWLTAAPESQSFYVSDPNLLISLLKPLAKEYSHEKELQSGCEPLLSGYPLRWRFVRWLRNHPKTTSSPAIQPEASRGPVHDIRTLPLSQMDVFAIRSPDQDFASRYRKAVMKVLASDVVALGQPALIDAFFSIVRMLLCWVFLHGVSEARTLSALGAASPSNNAVSKSEFWHTLRLVCELCGLHMWWCLKAIY